MRRLFLLPNRCNMQKSDLRISIGVQGLLSQLMVWAAIRMLVRPRRLSCLNHNGRMPEMTAVEGQLD